MSRVGKWLALVVATFALLEIGTLLLVRGGYLNSPPPRYGGTGFWRGHHAEFGVWHEPNAQIQHTGKCFNTRYTTNSVGARDIERDRKSEEPRVVVLGDSFLEGWGVAASQRLSNILERETGRAHLNFAMAHFSPYQQLIVYERLASGFEHDAVIASLAPINDFLDLDLDNASRMARYDYKYRPYLIGEPPEFEHFDYLEPPVRRELRRYSFLFNALLQTVRDIRAEESPEQRSSKFYEFTEREFNIMEAVLARLARAAANKRVALVVIPTMQDLEQRSVSGPDPLSKRLAVVTDRLGIQLVNLLPEMANYRFNPNLDWTGYFFPCDYHWSREGNRAAARILRQHLGERFYGVDTGRASSGTHGGLDDAEESRSD
ncbi:MAG: hypothetical protein VCE43_19605 [Myxococcota bacterium]